MKKSIYNNIIILNKNLGFIYNSYSNKFLFANKKLLDLFKVEPLDFIKRTYVTFYNRLVNTGIIVRDEVDEPKLALDTLQKNDTEKRIFHLTILPTMDCIFKCWYCYEDHIKDTKMSRETIYRVEKLLNNIVNDTNIKNLHISFFGGEPFLYYDTMMHFIKYTSKISLRDDIDITYSVTTNGYLIKEYMVKELEVYCVKRMNFQITLDGNRNLHNRVRHMQCGVGSYDTILKNLKSILSNQMHVKLRLNYTDKNIDSMLDIRKDLSFLTSDEKKFLNIMFYRVWQNINSGNIDAKVDAIAEKFVMEGFDVSTMPPANIHTSCYADKKNGVLIYYNGDMYRCTARNFAKTPPEGFLNEEGELIWFNDINQKRLAAKYKNEQCHKCRIFPICKGGCSQRALENYGTRYCIYNWDDRKKDYVVKALMKESIKNIKNRSDLLKEYIN